MSGSKPIILSAQTSFAEFSCTLASRPSRDLQRKWGWKRRLFLTNPTLLPSQSTFMMRIVPDIAKTACSMWQEANVNRPERTLVHYGRKSVLTNKSLYNGISLFLIRRQQVSQRITLHHQVTLTIGLQDLFSWDG